MSRWWPRSLAGPGDRAADRGDRGGRAGRQRAGAVRRPPATVTPPPRQQVLGIATALADSPSTAAAIESGNATATLQPVTEAVRKNTDIAFITIMAPDRTRFTHTDPTQIGGKYIGTIEPALRGETFTEVYTGTLGPSIRAVAPVRDGTGRIVGLVSAGILQQSLADRWRSQVPDDRRGERCRAGHRSGRGVGDPAPAVAADPRPAPRRAAGDVRAPRRDPAFGVRGADRAWTATA